MNIRLRPFRADELDILREVANNPDFAPVHGDHYEIGIVLRPEHRGRGIGWRAQALLTAYVFEHFPVQRVQAGTQTENAAERKSLLKAGFQEEGVVRAAEFRAGQWRDCVLFSRLRDDPYPELGD